MNARPHDIPPSPARSVRIDAQPGRASVRIDDAEVGQYVVGYTLSHDVHSALPELVLHTRNPEGAVWEGLARVAVGVQQSPAEVVAAFLSAVDPDELDRAALNRTDMGSGKGAVARAMLAQLTEWARTAGEAG